MYALGFLGLILISNPGEPTTSAGLLAESLHLLQQSEKSKALRYLEKAFQKSQDTDELREITLLLLEASPQDYPRREAYLRYLIKNQSEHADAYKWLKELGDRSFHKGKLEEAEDWYLRSLALLQERNSRISESKPLIQYKLAFVKWNLKQPMEALRTLLDTYTSADEGLKSQIRGDLVKIWWEIGALPPADFERIIVVPESELTEILKRLFEHIPKDISWSEKEELFLRQLKETSATRELTQKFLTEASHFRTSPCFLFSGLLQADDGYSENLLLACLKAKHRPSAEKLMPFFAKFEDRRDEIFLWARAELLEATRQTPAAISILFRIDDFSISSQNFRKYTESLLLQLNEETFRETLSSIGTSAFECFLKVHYASSLFERLAVIDPGHWIPFEENLLPGKAPPDFLLRKAAWLASQAETPLDTLERLMNEIISASKDKTAKSVSKALQSLREKVHTKLPQKFSKKFKLSLDRWLKDLDAAEISLKLIPSNWLQIVERISRNYLKENFEAIVRQIESLELDPELSDLRDTFQQKKEEMKNELRSRFELSGGGGK
jgi:tetratricopeptide (TPR) repeat protein